MDDSSRPQRRMYTLPYAYAGLSLIEGVDFGIDEATRLIASYPLPVVIDTVARVLCVLEKATFRAAIEPQLELLLRMCNNKYVAVVKSRASVLDAHDGEPHKILFFSTQLYCALKLAVMHCNDRTGTGTDRDLTDLARALLIISDNIDKERGGLAENDWFIQSLFREMVFGHRERWPNAAARWDCLLTGIPERLRGHHHYLDLRASFREATGLDPDLFQAYAFAYMATYHQFLQKGPDRLQMHVDAAGWMKNYSIGPEADGLRSLMCASADEWKQDFMNALPLSRQPYYFLPFLRRPAVEAVGRMWIPSPQFLEEKLTAGLFHVILTHLREVDGPKERGRLEKLGQTPAEAKRSADKITQRLLDFRGAVFEEYVGDLLGRVQIARPTFRVLRLDPSACPGARLCDFVVLEGRRAVLVECKSRFFTMDSVVSGDVAVISEDYRRIAVEAAEQINSTIDAIECGRLGERGLKPYEIDVYLPVVCTLQYVPTDFSTYRFLTDTVRTRGHLQQLKSNHLQVADVGSMEVLEPELQAGLALSDILIKKNLDNETRSSSLWNFVAEEGLGRKTNQFLLDTFNRLSERTMQFWREREKRP
jgi:hypothetical protein